MNRYARTILMRDPAYFRIQAGANSHTRNRWGLKKKVNVALARRQWDRAVETFRGHGLWWRFCPASLSERLLGQLRALNIRPVELDVSEFFEKRGRSMKCMLCDLGLRRRNPVIESKKPRSPARADHLV